MGTFGGSRPAYLLTLLILTAAFHAANAQTTTHWSANLTVQGNSPIFGCSYRTCRSALSNNLFTYRGTTYRVAQITLHTGRYLSLDTTPNIPTSSLYGLNLIIDGASYPFRRNSRYPEGYHTWGASQLSWNAGDVVSLKITSSVIAPDRLGELTGRQGAGTATLSWRAPSNDGGAAITHYEYRYATEGNPYPATWTTVPDGPDADTDAANERSVTVTGLANGTQYRFQVRAVNSKGGGRHGFVKVTPNSPPDSADATIDLKEDTFYRFSSKDFPFVDPDPGDTFDGFSVVTEPSRGRVIGVPRRIGGYLVRLVPPSYRPFPNADGPDTWEFKVSDGQDWSPVYTMTMNVLPVNDRATGRPTILGHLQVGQTLTASTAGIADVEGLTGVSYQYQWIRVDGGTEAEISGALSSSYTLTAADEGKRIKVTVEFRDDAGSAESLASETTEPVQGQAGQGPLSAEFTGAPTQHDGSPFQVTLVVSEELPGLSFTAVRDIIAVAGGEITNVGHVTPPSNRRYELTVSPSPLEAVTLTFPQLPACGLSGAICTDDGRSIAGPVTLRIPVSVSVHGSPATVSSVAVTSAPLLPSNTYGRDEVIEFTVTFSAAVTVTGDPEFEFSLNNPGDPASTRRARYDARRSTAATAVFVYPVVATDSDTDGISVGDHTQTLKLDADDTIVTTSNDVTAVLDHDQQGIQPGHKVDGSQAARARVASVAVTSTPILTSDTYGRNEVIEFTVTFSQAVTVAGDPLFEFSLNNPGQPSTRRRAKYDASRSTATTAVFVYTVLRNDRDTNGIWIGNHVGTFVLDSDDGIVTTSTDVPAELVHERQGTQPGHKVDGARSAGATVASVAVTSTPTLSSDTYGRNQVIEFTATFSEAVAVTGDPEFEFALGNPGQQSDFLRRADYDADRSTATTAVFVYTVVATDRDTNGIWIGNQTRTFKLDDDDSIVTNSNDVPANLDHAVQGTQSAHKVDGSLVPRATVTSVAVTSTPSLSSDTYGRDESIEITVTFSEAVTVTGDPEFEFSPNNPASLPASVAQDTTSTVAPPPRWSSFTPWWQPTRTPTASGLATIRRPSSWTTTTAS